MPHPLLYEINTRCWLRELSEKNGQEITLANIPEVEFSQWRELGFSHIWLMGVWPSGPRARARALADPIQRAVYSEVLPDWQPQDVAGSPYAIADYHVASAMGGEAGLEVFRRRLHAYGMKLILDFVPNHLGVDHPWVQERPDLFVQSAVQLPETFVQSTAAGPRWLAHGKDPYFGAWTDTVQLDYRHPPTRAAMREVLRSVADRSDGVRCDMSMLLLNDVFAKTWQRFPPPCSPPASEFWEQAISTVKRSFADFLFLAEVYWDLEPRLQALGFDYTYDKQWYDEVRSRRTGAVQRHLLSHPPDFLDRSAYFLENHDEPRAASVFAPAEHRAAALLLLGLPGMRFLHEGQLAGARLRTPVQLVRRPREPHQSEVETMYRDFLTVLQTTDVGKGIGQLCAPRPAWPNNPTSENLVVVYWQVQSPEFDLVVVNLAPHASQGYVSFKNPGLSRHDWSMKNRLGEQEYRRGGQDLQDQGLYLELPGYGAQLFHFRPIG